MIVVGTAKVPEKGRYVMEEDTINCQECCVHHEKISELRRTLVEDLLVYDVADFFKVLGDSTRVRILFAIAEGEVCVGDIAEALNMTHSSVSHQLRVLRQSGLVKHRKDGKTVFYAIDDAHVNTILWQGLTHIKHKRNETD